jgi:hypothetical protein
MTKVDGSDYNNNNNYSNMNNHRHVYMLQVNNLTKYIKTVSWAVNETDGLQTSRSRLETIARPALFPGGRMTVRCESNQFQLYKKYSVIELTDDSPRLAQMISPTTVMRAGESVFFL